MIVERPISSSQSSGGVDALRHEVGRLHSELRRMEQSLEGVEEWNQHVFVRRKSEIIRQLLFVQRELFSALRVAA
jgi:hypothetical protein